MRRLPCFTLAVALLSAMATFWQEAFDLMVYDRAAVLGGQWWRLMTGHLVHYSGYHLAINLIAFIPVGAAVSWRGHRRFALGMCLSSILIGLSFLYLMPRMAFYAGLSGVVNAAYAFLCVSEIYREGSRAGFWSVMLVLVFLKSTTEFLTGQTFFVGAPGTASFIALPAAHMMGAVAGSISAYWARKRESD